jgi:hypothetical protein
MPDGESEPMVPATIYSPTTEAGPQRRSCLGATVGRAHVVLTAAMALLVGCLIGAALAAPPAAPSALLGGGSSCPNAPLEGPASSLTGEPIP